MIGPTVVTGANGFVGRHVIRKLEQSGHQEVVALHQGNAPLDAGPLTTWKKVNLFDRVAVEELLLEFRPRSILHLAWYTEPGAFWSSLENVKWAEATLALFRTFTECGGKRFVGVGTGAEYAPTTSPCREDVTPGEPDTLYGASKLATWMIISHAARAAGVSAAWGRIFQVYGPGEQADRLIPSVTQSLLSVRPVQVTEGSQIRDFVYVNDVAEALLRLLSNEVSGAFNIGSGSPAKVRDVVDHLADLIGGRELIEQKAPSPPTERPVLSADISKLTRASGWVPRYSLRDGLQETVMWWKSILEGNDAVS